MGKNLIIKQICFVVTGLIFFQHSISQNFLRAADSLRKYRSIPGMTYAVFTSDQIIELAASGFRVYRSRDKVQIGHRFQIGTSTTGFTTYLAARLVEKGKISWNTRIIDIFPEWNGKIIKIYHNITLRQLLSHRAGIQPYTEIENYHQIHSLQGNYVQQRKTFSTIALKQKPLLVLDSSVATYSVAGTVIATAMLEKITGKPWEDLVRDHINKNLNISAGFGFPNAQDSTQPIGHWDNYGAITAEPDNYWAQSFVPIAPASSIQLSITDYIKFVQDILRALNNKKSIIAERSANQFLFGYPGDAMGWKNTVWHNYNIAGWSGRGTVYSSYVEIIKEKNLGIIVLCNSGTSKSRAGIMNFGKLLREYYAGKNSSE